MKTRLRDVVWAALAALLVAIVTGSVVLVFTSDGDVVKLLVGAVPALLLAVGCWRRTKWGAPEGGLRSWQEDRKTGNAEHAPEGQSGI